MTLFWAHPAFDAHDCDPTQNSLEVFLEYQEAINGGKSVTLVGRAETQPYLPPGKTRNH